LFFKKIPIMFDVSKFSGFNLNFFNILDFFKLLNFFKGRSGAPKGHARNGFQDFQGIFPGGRRKNIGDHPGGQNGREGQGGGGGRAREGERRAERGGPTESGKETPDRDFYGSHVLFIFPTLAGTKKNSPGGRRGPSLLLETQLDRWRLEGGLGLLPLPPLLLLLPVVLGLSFSFLLPACSTPGPTFGPRTYFGSYLGEFRNSKITPKI
jgi:hypothetical protein